MAGRPPGQPQLTDRRTGGRADLLFAFRARRVSTGYINHTVIPMLCRKAGVPAADVRGAITGHRARSTIARQLCNAKEPMTLFELQAWPGHRSRNHLGHGYCAYTFFEQCPHQIACARCDFLLSQLADMPPPCRTNTTPARNAWHGQAALGHRCASRQNLTKIGQIYSTER